MFKTVNENERLCLNLLQIEAYLILLMLVFKTRLTQHKFVMNLVEMEGKEITMATSF